MRFSTYFRYNVASLLGEVHGLLTSHVIQIHIHEAQINDESSSYMGATGNYECVGCVFIH